MDRFAVQLRLGYLPPAGEVEILAAQLTGHPLDGIEPVVTVAELVELRRHVQAVRVAPEVMRYIVDLVAATRLATGVRLGAGPRASLALMKTGQALAFLDGLTYLPPDRVQELAVPVLAHRLVLDPGATFSGRGGAAVVAEIVQRIPVPV
jgi:MoxR-like ATPase